MQWPAAAYSSTIYREKPWGLNAEPILAVYWNTEECLEGRHHPPRSGDLLKKLDIIIAIVLDKEA